MESETKQRGTVAENLAEVLIAALGVFDEGIAVLDSEARVLIWNPAAAAISGYLSADMLSRPLPKEAYEIDVHHLEANRAEAERSYAELTLMERRTPGRPAGDTDRIERPLLVHIRHRQGHSLPAMLRRTALRDELGKRFGTLLRFHPVEEIDTLPHGEGSGCDDDMQKNLEGSQAALEDRLDEAMREWKFGEVPFGVLWIAVDQAALLRKTHGRDASEAMLRIMEQMLLHGLRPTEMLGRWGTNEYLVLSHERTPEMLEGHAQHLAELARKADFRWWGDRVPLTISVGAAQSEQNQTLARLLQRAQAAIENSQRSGGNQVTKARADEASEVGGQ